MATATLVSLPLAEGRRLLERLDAAGLDITVALWEYDEEVEAWRFVLSSALVDSRGPLFLIERVQNALAEMSDTERGDLSLADIAVVGPHLRRIEGLRRVHGVVEEERRIAPRFLGADEPYIYRLIS
jgi:hypothetical protein